MLAPYTDFPPCCIEVMIQKAGLPLPSERIGEPTNRSLAGTYANPGAAPSRASDPRATTVFPPLPPVYRPKPSRRR